MKTITVYDEDVSYAVPTDAYEFVDFWLDKLEAIPEEFRDTAKIELEVDNYYDMALMSATVSFTRPETKEELEVETKHQELTDARIRKSKVEAYNKLKQELEL